MIEITKKNLITNSNYKITSAETDMFARIRLSAFANLLIQSAINSADSLGFGYKNMIEQKLFWVLNRLTIELYKPLQWYDEAVVETWPKDVVKLLYLRDFIIRDKKDQIVGKAVSSWLAIDQQSKRPKKIDGIHAALFDHLKDKYALNQMPEKLDGVKRGEEFEVSSKYFDIDLNKHVTASRYIDWMMDSFDNRFHEKHYPKQLSINYMKETMPEEKIRIRRSHHGNHEYHFEGFNLNSNSVAFRGNILF